MITAAQAKELYDQSGKEVADFLKFKVEPAVMEAAKAGKRHIAIFLDSKGPFDRLDQAIKPVHRSVLAKLKELGYEASIAVYGDKYVPRGLADDVGNGPMYQNYGILVGW